MKMLKAARTGKIFVVPADPVSSPTPSTYLEGLEAVAKALHPEAFGKTENK
jgi:ABC-type Fe3+-hydroxamate transport system substrate-binding protein